MIGRWKLATALLVVAAAGCGDKLDAVQVDAPLVVDGPVTYVDHIAPLLQQCQACHGAVTPRAGVRLDSFENARSNADRADETIQSGRMPPSGGLRQSERDLFSQWIVDGLRETRPAATRDGATP